MESQYTKEEMKLINIGLSLSLSNEKLIIENKQLVETNGQGIKDFCEEYEQNKELRMLCFDVFRFFNIKKVLTKQEEDLKDKMSCALSDFIV